MDFRFVDGLNRWLDEQGLTNQYDRVVVAGAAKNFVDPTQPSDVEFITRQIDIAQRLHAITEVWLINHRDCGAYGKIFATPEAETARHTDDLAKAKTLIEQQFGLTVKTFLATLGEGNTVLVESLA
jgi:carbonic anhydrase